MGGRATPKAGPAVLQSIHTGWATIGTGLCPSFKKFGRTLIWRILDRLTRWIWQVPIHHRTTASILKRHSKSSAGRRRWSSMFSTRTTNWFTRLVSTVSPATAGAMARPSSVSTCRWLIVQVSFPSPKVFRQHHRKSFRRPADQVRDLPVTDLNDPKPTFGSLHNVK